MLDYFQNLPAVALRAQVLVNKPTELTREILRCIYKVGATLSYCNPYGPYNKTLVCVPFRLDVWIQQSAWSSGC